METEKDTFETAPMLGLREKSQKSEKYNPAAAPKSQVSKDSSPKIQKKRNSSKKSKPTDAAPIKKNTVKNSDKPPSTVNKKPVNKTPASLNKKPIASSMNKNPYTKYPAASSLNKKPEKRPPSTATINKKPPAENKIPSSLNKKPANDYGTKGRAREISVRIVKMISFLYRCFIAV